MAQSGTPYKLDPDQVLRAAKALLKAIEKSKDEVKNEKTSKKPDLLAGDDDQDEVKETPIWLVFTAKNHILDSNRLKPGKIKIPHPLLTTKDTRICLITADPPKDRPSAYKDLIASPAFPDSLRAQIPKTIAVSRLKAKYSTFELKRKLLAEYDVFLADERIITGLPVILGKPFFKSTTKRPIPVDLTGKERYAGQGRPEKGKLVVKKRRDTQEGGSTIVGTPQDVAAEIERTLYTTLVHLAPSATTSVKAGLASFTAQQLQENVQVIVEKMVETWIPKKWRGVKSIHVKTPTSAALPIWLSDELWVDEEQVLDSRETPKEENKKSKKRKSEKSNERAGKKVKTISDAGPKAVKV